MLKLARANPLSLIPAKVSLLLAVKARYLSCAVWYDLRSALYGISALGRT